MSQILKIEPRDSMLFRDSRPFGADPGATAYSLPMPFPSVLAGTIRTILGKDQNGLFDSSLVDTLLKKKIKGPLLIKGNTDDNILFPAPLDILITDKENKKEEIEITGLAPKQIDSENEGTTLPCNLKPVMPSKTIKGKPSKKTPAFWNWQTLKKWLNNITPAPEDIISDNESLFDYEKRTHISIEPDTKTVKEGMLFTTSSVRYNETVSFLCEIDDDKEINGFHKFGGEGRLASFSKSRVQFPKMPEDILKKIKENNRFKLQLVTPAPFGYKQWGWCPDWLEENDNGELVGNLPNLSEDLLLKLEGVTVGRPLPYSGWDLHKKEPKRIRWFSPAGSVYFFSVKEGNANILKDLWLESICSGIQDINDSFGLTLIGNY